MLCAAYRLKAAAGWRDAQRVGRASPGGRPGVIGRVRFAEIRSIREQAEAKSRDNGMTNLSAVSESHRQSSESTQWRTTCTTAARTLHSTAQETGRGRFAIGRAW
jgi:hypothetical protein